MTRFTRKNDNILVRCIFRWRRILIVVLVTSLVLFGFLSHGLPAPKGIPLSEPAVCSETFGTNRTVDLVKIASYKFPDVTPYRKLLFPSFQDPTKLYSTKHEIEHGSHVTVPAIVTGADFSHFKESLNLVMNLNEGIRKVFTDIKLVYFDLGIARFQRNQLEEICRCEVRTFPFEKLPSHLKILKGYAWKPVCLQLVLNEYPFAMWMDASVRLKTNDLDWLFTQIKEQGVLAGEGGESIAARTKEPTFKFLNEPPCLYRRHEFEGTFIAVYQSKYVQAYFMQPWVSCALSLGCMVLDSYPLIHLRCQVIDHYYHECHRFDQSVLSMLLHRLYHTDIEKHMMKRYTFYQYCSEGEQWRILPESINDYINKKWYTYCKYG